jgi:hypothetical protein
MFRKLAAAAAAFALLATAGASNAGAVYLTGHDPDFHAQGQVSGQNQLNVALNFVTGGSYNTGSQKFLWVESFDAPISGHLIGANGLVAIGLVQGVNYDWVDAAGLAALPNFNGYSAIAVASTFGGMLKDAEIQGLVARKTEIAAFVNAGGGLFASAECGPGFPVCDATLVNASTPLYGFVPITASSVSTTAPYHVTPYGASLGLTDLDVDDCCTHNSFASAAGLNIVDVDATGIPTTLAGVVTIGGGGFGVPEPGAWAMLILGFGMIGLAARRRTGVVQA